MLREYVNVPRLVRGTMTPADTGELALHLSPSRPMGRRALLPRSGLQGCKLEVLRVALAGCE